MNNNKAMAYLVKRNIKLYFKDKLTFFTSLITPMILLVLFVTFLRRVYESSFLAFVPEGIEVGKQIINGFTGGWLISSILGVSCVTIAFCSNVVMIQDKINGSITDLLVTPVKKGSLAMGYYLANLVTTLIVCLTTLCVGLIYLGAVGWYLSAADLLLILLDVLLSTLFGTAFAALVEYFISTQGGATAVATLVSSLYGFICGAYMPISQFSGPVQNAVSLLPGTYTISLFRNHFMNGVISELDSTLPSEMVTALRDSFDANVYFFGHRVEQWQMYAVVAAAIVLLSGAYILLNVLHNRKKIK